MRVLSRIVVVSLLAILFPITASQATTTSYSGSFTQLQPASTTAANNWATFRTNLSGTYDQITITSSNGLSISVADSVKVPQIAQTLRNWSGGSPVYWQIGSLWVSVGACGSGPEITIGPSTSICGCYGSLSSGYFTARPQIGNENWGGAGITCSAASQSITVTFNLRQASVSEFISSQQTPTKTALDIDFTLAYTLSVSGVTSSDFSNAGTASNCVFSVNSSSGMNFIVTVSSCSEGTLLPRIAQGSATDSLGNSVPSTATNASTIITIDRTSPTISSVTAPSNGTYSPTGLPLGPTLSFSVLMSESVTVSGFPRLTLTIGSVSRYATYLSQSDSRTLTFQYTPATSLDEIDSDGIAMASSLDLNGGSISDLATNALSNTSLTPPTLTGVLIAQRASAPTITSITAGNTQLSIAFTAGASNGAAITNYKYSLGGGSFTAFSPTDTTSPLVITGLTNGTSYAVRILAITSVGDGESSTAVTATPTAIVVGGGSDITVTYGSAGTSSAFTATGGTSPYAFSLSPGVTGVSIDPSTGVVTTSSSLAAGSYTTFVIATDSASRSGQKAISILVSQETPTISIALTGGVTTAPLGVAISIIASVSEEGSVAFFLGGSSIAGCSAVASSSGTATCSWTPGSLGSVSLSAILTPIDSANYLSETSSALAITVVTGTSAISLAITGTPTKGSTITITATTTDLAGKVAFFLHGKRIIGCKSKTVASGEAICLWKLSRHGEQTLSARFTPTNTAYRASSAQMRVVGLRRVSR